MTAPRALGALAAVGVSAFVLSGCVATTDVPASATLTVTSSADACTVSSETAVSGTLAFEIENAGDQITEFYLLAEDGVQIVAEAENIAPGTTRTLTLVAQPGEYITLCKPGMTGDGVGRAAFTVTGERVEGGGADAQLRDEAVEQYADYVRAEVDDLVPAVATLADAYASGDDDAARSAWTAARVHYERIEPVAEALGDLDPKIDYRELDAYAEGLEWTGFHRMEKDLWVPAADAVNSDGVTSAWQDWEPSTDAERQAYADALVTDVQALSDYVHGEDFSRTLEDQGVASLSNGAIALLDEVAHGKITGEEDWWSRTDLYDFAANVEGSQMAFTLVHDVAAATPSGAELAEQIEEGYADLEAALAEYGSLEDGFVGYDTVTESERADLTALINALAEPLSQLTATVLS